MHTNQGMAIIILQRTLSNLNGKWIVPRYMFDTLCKIVHSHIYKNV